MACTLLFSLALSNKSQRREMELHTVQFLMCPNFIPRVVSSLRLLLRNHAQRAQVADCIFVGFSRLFKKGTCLEIGWTAQAD
jgi:hypothetical protein